MQRSSRPFRRGRLTLAFLCLATHALLDGLTVYGTQLLWPLPLAPTTWSTIFIIDPAFTLPLLVGIIGASIWRSARGARWNVWGLAVGSAYLAFTIGAKLHVDRVGHRALEEGGIEHEQFISIASPFNAVLWRLLVMDEAGYREGYYSLLDGDRPIVFRRFPGHYELLDGIRGDEAVQRLQWFTKGFFAVKQEGPRIYVTDLRMGFEPAYVFSFQVGAARDGRVVTVPNRRVESEPGQFALSWIWRRIWDPHVLPP